MLNVLILITIICCAMSNGILIISHNRPYSKIIDIILRIIAVMGTITGVIAMIILLYKALTL